jgi:hypothetical protein
MFRIDEYVISKAQVVAAIKATHKWETTEGFIGDGLISPLDYRDSHPRIAVILGESYGYDACGYTDIEKQPTEDILGVSNPDVKTAKKMPALLWLLYESFVSRKVIEWDNIPFLFRSTPDNANLLQSALKKAAWINVKKASKHVDESGSDATRQDYQEIYEHARRNQAVLAMQISVLTPDLIIACSDPVMHALCDMKLLGDGIERDKKWQVQTTPEMCRVIHVSHPSYFRDWGYTGIFETAKIILESFQIS